MKFIAALFVLFSAIAVYAQEMDTTFVVNEQGETIGLVHEKGTIPEIPPGFSGNGTNKAYQVSSQESDQQASTFAFDSTAYYQSLIDRYTESGNGKRKAGKGMMIGGGILAGIGAVVFAIGAQESCDTDYYGYEICTNNSDMLAGTGAVVALSGATVFGIGIVIKSVGSSRLRKAKRYSEILARYQLKRQYSIRLRIDPLIDVINKNAGANLALEF